MGKVEGDSWKKEFANENNMGQRSGNGRKKTMSNAATVKFLRSCFYRSYFTCISTACCCTESWRTTSLEFVIDGDVSEHSLRLAGSLPSCQNGALAAPTQVSSWGIDPRPKFCLQSCTEKAIVSVTGRPFSYWKTDQMSPATTTTLF